MPSTGFIGELVELRWYYSSTALQGFQAQAFANGGPLPPGYGIDPTEVYLDIQSPAASVETTYQYGSSAIVRETTGIYHYLLDTTSASGKWWWRAYSTGTGQASFEDYVFVQANLAGPGD